MLCGGASARMGVDKALLEVDGVAMALRTADALLASGVEQVVAVGGDSHALERLGLATVGDSRPRSGPLAAIGDALTWSHANIVLVVSCDLLDPDPSAMRITVEALVAAPDALVAVPVVDDQRQWTHAAWRREAGPLLGQQIARGERAIWRALRGAAVAEVLGVAAAAVADADLPSDLRGRGPAGSER